MTIKYLEDDNDRNQRYFRYNFCCIFEKNNLFSVSGYLKWTNKKTSSIKKLQVDIKQNEIQYLCFHWNISLTKTQTSNTKQTAKKPVLKNPVTKTCKWFYCGLLFFHLSQL